MTVVQSLEYTICGKSVHYANLNSLLYRIRILLHSKSVVYKHCYAVHRHNKCNQWGNEYMSYTSYMYSTYFSKHKQEHTCTQSKLKSTRTQHHSFSSTHKCTCILKPEQTEQFWQSLILWKCDCGLKKHLFRTETSERKLQYKHVNSPRLQLHVHKQRRGTLCWSARQWNVPEIS